MRNIILVLTSIFLLQCSVKAQSVVIYRAGIPLSPSYTSIATALTNTVYGDSVVLSAHTFYEHDLLVNNAIKLTGIANGTIIDAQSLGRCIYSYKDLVIKNVILQNGRASDVGGGVYCTKGSLELQGRTVIRNCYAAGYMLSLPTKTGGGGIMGAGVTLRDNVLITNNSADGKGGGIVGAVYMYDSATISYNSTTEHGGGVYGTIVGISSPNASVVYNTASKNGGGLYGIDSGNVFFGYNTAGWVGGAIYGFFGINGARILGNQAPKGAAIGVDSGLLSPYINNSYIFNPSPTGTRQNEIYCDSKCRFNSQRCWWGKGDTIGIFKVGSLTAGISVGSWVVPNWQLNRGVSPAKKDTLFPLQAALKYNMGVALVAGSMPWLKGYFSSSKGTMTPTMASVNAKDTIQSMFKSFIAPPVSQPVDFVAYIDLDTFKVTQLVWGIDTTTKKDTTTKGAIVEPNPVQVYVYPIPASNELHISGAAIGSMAALFDMNGRQILTMKIEEFETILPIHNIAVGTYTLRILAHNGSIGIAKVQKE